MTDLRSPDEDERLAQWCEQQAHDCETFVAFGERMGGSPDAIADFATPAATYRAIASRLRSPRAAQEVHKALSGMCECGHPLTQHGKRGDGCDVEGCECYNYHDAAFPDAIPSEAAPPSGKPVVSDSGVRPRDMRRALSFAASVIKSGEPWTAECERIIGGALASGQPVVAQEEEKALSEQQSGAMRGALEHLSKHGSLADAAYARDVLDMVGMMAESPTALSDDGARRDRVALFQARAEADALAEPPENAVLSVQGIADVLAKYDAIRTTWEKENRKHPPFGDDLVPLLAETNRLVIAADRLRESVVPVETKEQPIPGRIGSPLAAEATDRYADHPWFGPCDGFGKGGECSECERLTDAAYVIQSWRGFASQQDRDLARIAQSRDAIRKNYDALKGETKEQGAIQAECFEAMALAVGVLREVFEKRAFTTLPNLEGKAIAAEHRLDRALRKLNALTSESPVSVGESLDAPKEELQTKAYPDGA